MYTIFKLEYSYKHLSLGPWSECPLVQELGELVAFHTTRVDNPLAPSVVHRRPNPNRHRG